MVDQRVNRSTRQQHAIVQAGEHVSNLSSLGLPLTSPLHSAAARESSCDKCLTKASDLRALQQHTCSRSAFDSTALRCSCMQQARWKTKLKLKSDACNLLLKSSPYMLLQSFSWTYPHQGILRLDPYNTWVTMLPSSKPLQERHRAPSVGNQYINALDDYGGTHLGAPALVCLRTCSSSFLGACSGPSPFLRFGSDTLRRSCPFVVPSPDSCTSNAVRPCALESSRRKCNSTGACVSMYVWAKAASLLVQRHGRQHREMHPPSATAALLKEGIIL